jgi:hypothetical protein
MRVWQYNGVALWKEIITWCKDNLNRNNWVEAQDHIYFYDDGEYAWFLLRWS